MLKTQEEALIKTENRELYALCIEKESQIRKSKLRKNKNVKNILS